MQPSLPYAQNCVLPVGLTTTAIVAVPHVNRLVAIKDTGCHLYDVAVNFHITYNNNYRMFGYPEFLFIR